MSYYPDGDPESTPTVIRLRAEFPDRVLSVDEHRGDLSVRISRPDHLAVLRFLRDDPDTDYNFLMDVVGVDWLGRDPRFDLVYILYSLAAKHRVRVHVGVPEEHPVIDSATAVWKSAEWFEREAYDLLGIQFRSHPFLRRLLTHDDFQGHALRKDYDQRQRWRCTRVSDLEGTVEVPEEPAAEETA